MSTMSSALFALATQNAFSRAVDELRRRLRREHVHVDRAELGELLAERLDVLVEPVLVRALHHHHEVGEGAVLARPRDAEVEADVAR